MLENTLALAPTLLELPMVPSCSAQPAPSSILKRNLSIHGTYLATAILCVWKSDRHVCAADAVHVCEYGTVADYLCIHLGRDLQLGHGPGCRAGEDTHSGQCAHNSCTNCKSYVRTPVTSHSKGGGIGGLFRSCDAMLCSIQAILITESVDRLYLHDTVNL